MGAGDHAYIGCRVYSSTKTSHCDSSHKHRTKRQRRCVSRLCPTSSLASSMLFRVVCSDNVGLWASATVRATAEDSVTFWAKVVGVDAACVSDRTLLRVLELGGKK